MQNNEEINISKLKQYLLGNLTAPEIEAIDLRVISDGSIEDELYLAESELMEDYLDETLSSSEMKLFADNFLVSAERKAHLKQIFLIRNYARKAVPEGVAEKALSKKPESFVEKLKVFFR